ncbi:hypothetical protein BJ875DRAFT_384915, partial [Amylocarpus encephaloides]
YATSRQILVAGLVFPILGIVAVLLRFYVRLSRKQVIGLDDWLIIPALVFVTGTGACLIAGVKAHAIGYPTPKPKGASPQERLTSVNPQIQIVHQVEFVITILLILTYGFIKLSILYFYRHLLVHTNKVFSYLAWCLMGIVAIWMLVFPFVIAFNCGTQFHYMWGSTQDLIAHCGNGIKKQEALYVSEFVTNVLLVILPIPTIWRLQMQWQKKLAVTGILLLRFMAFIASILRLVIVLQVTASSYQAVIYVDLTISTIFYWGMIEAGLAFIFIYLFISI